MTVNLRIPLTQKQCIKNIQTIQLPCRSNVSATPYLPAKPHSHCCNLLWFQMKNLLSHLPLFCFHNMATRDFQNILLFHCMDLNRYTSALYFIDAVFQHSKKSLLIMRNKKIHKLWHCPNIILFHFQHKSQLQKVFLKHL